MTEDDSTVCVRIDVATQQRAARVLEASGLTLSDAIRLLLRRIADEQRLPFDAKIPNQTTRDAIAESEAGTGRSFDTIDDLMNELNSDD